TNQSGGKANAVVSVSCAARFEKRKAGGIRGLALHRAGRMDRRGAGAQRRSLHGCSSRPEKRPRPLFDNETTVAVRVSSCGVSQGSRVRRCSSLTADLLREN